MSHTTMLGMKDLSIHYPLLDLLDSFSYLTIYGDRGDLAVFGKQRNAMYIICGRKILNVEVRFNFIRFVKSIYISPYISSANQKLDFKFGMFSEKLVKI